MKRFLSLLLLPLLWGSVWAQEGRLLRFPTSNGKEVTFSYAGDLYRAPIAGGVAQRLTSHVGEEIFPHYSPDGRTIAFSAQYDGNTEVYIMPATGGAPRRITFTATNARDDLGDRMGPNNVVMGWTPDGRQVVYRNRISDGFEGRLYLADTAVALPQELPLPEGGFCSYSPDSKRLAYNRVFREFRTWKYYHGGMADEIWIHDFAAKTTENITKNPAQDIFPMWIGGTIYFLSDRDRTMNLFAYDTETKTTKKVTNFDAYDVKFPSTNGQEIVYENAGYIWRFDPSTGQNARIPIQLSSEDNLARDLVKAGKDYVRGVDVSNSGKLLAISARGEIFCVPTSKGVTYNVTRTPGAHEQQVDISPDDRYISYVSDQSGEYEIWLYDVKTQQREQLTSGTTSYILGYVWHPKSESIIFATRDNSLYSVGLKDRKSKLLQRSEVGPPNDVKFSPDGEWIAYTMPAENDFSVVYLRNLSTGAVYPVTDPWFSSYDPLFSQDGKYLYFNSARTFVPMYGSLEWNHIYSNMFALYLVPLSRETPSPFLEGVEDKASEPAEDAGKSKKKAKAKSEPASSVRIDPEGLPLRVLRVPTPGGYHGLNYADEGKVYYRRGGALYLYQLKEQKETKIVDNGQMAVSDAGKQAVIFQDGKVYAMARPSGPVTLKDPVDLEGMKLPVNYPAEWRQIYNEAWRIYRDWFYVSNMHGVDWPAIREKYAVLLPYVKSRLDLNYLIGEMIGELNVGHAYVTPGERPRAERIPMGLLGADIEHDGQGYRIRHIIPGATWSKTLRSPLHQPGLDVREGDYIVAIDGVETAKVQNIYELLVGKADLLTELLVNTRPTVQGARRLVVKPLRNEDPIRHYEWVQRNIATVDRLSGGRVGYIYVPDMGPDGLNEFSRYFYPQLRKEGLIIDDRSNGGGNVSPMLLERLQREPYRVTMSRFSTRVSTVPDATFHGPKVCLVNKYSASDGDLFPWGFRALGLGKIIGTRTWGGIVGISGSMPYMDGTDIRVPFFTSFDLDGNWIIENHGIDPDIVVDNDPAREYAGEDEQLARAVEEVVKQLKDRKPLPKIPAPRVWNR